MMWKYRPSCPICNKQLVVDYEDYIEGTIMEFVCHCADGHYSHDFAYGSFRETIGTKEWESHQSDSNEVYQKREAETRKTILEMRHEYEMAQKLLPDKEQA